MIVDSAFVGMRKPDPGIYELTIERLIGSEPEVAAAGRIQVDHLKVGRRRADEIGCRLDDIQEPRQCSVRVQGSGRNLWTCGVGHRCRIYSGSGRPRVSGPIHTRPMPMR